tara:strand:+ start:164 stop:856 length:693 start_codon:yes stop_codon:yes gene_type:complete
MSSKSKLAIILCGGLGTRLRPYTKVLPKPLMPINGKPILEIVINNLKKNNFKNIILSIGYKGDLIKSFFGNGEKYGVKINYIEENRPLGTMGPLNLIKKLPNDFLVMNGDILTTLNLNKFFKKHLISKSIFTISTIMRNHLIDYGVINSKRNKMTDFIEKPKKKFNVSMGIYAVNIKAVKHIPKNKYYGFDHLMRKFLKKNLDVNLFFFNGLWLDIGRQDDYIKAQDLKL